VVSIVPPPLKSEYNRLDPRIEKFAHSFDRARLGELGREINKARHFPGSHALSRRALFHVRRYMALLSNHVTIRGQSSSAAWATGTGWSLE
jgi:hypothetical protein